MKGGAQMARLTFLLTLVFAFVAALIFKQDAQGWTVGRSSYRKSCQKDLTHFWKVRYQDQHGVTSVFDESLLKALRKCSVSHQTQVRGSDVATLSIYQD